MDEGSGIKGLRTYCRPIRPILPLSPISCNKFKDPTPACCVIMQTEVHHWIPKDDSPQVERSVESDQSPHSTDNEHEAN